MSWFLVKCEYVLEDGSVYSRRGWFEGADFIDACEKARRDRQWDLRQEERVEFEIPQKVVSAKNSARRYNIRELTSFEIAGDRSKIINKQFEERDKELERETEAAFKDLDRAISDYLTDDDMRGLMQ